MSTVCTRCALRIQRAVRTSRVEAPRGFSMSSRCDAVPQFSDTPSTELNAALSTLRAKHFIPSTLSRRDLNHITNEKHKKALEENPLTIDVGGGEEINFTYFDGFDRPGRRDLVKRAIDLMAKSQNGAGWKELPSLLIGLKNMNRSPAPRTMAKIVRKAVQARHAGVIIECLSRPQQTGMTATNKDVLEQLIWNIRDVTRRLGWRPKQVKAAMSEFQQISSIMEYELGVKRWVSYEDPRGRPEIIGVFLEMAAVRAEACMEGIDFDGSVDAFTRRLLGCLKTHHWAPPETPAAFGPQFGMLYGSSIYHGLRLAQKLLGSKLPDQDQTKTVLADYEARLNKLEQAIAAKQPKPGSYGDQALSVWREVKGSTSV